MSSQSKNKVSLFHVSKIEEKIQSSLHGIQDPAYQAKLTLR